MQSAFQFCVVPYVPPLIADLSTRKFRVPGNASGISGWTDLENSLFLFSYLPPIVEKQCFAKFYVASEREELPDDFFRALAILCFRHPKKNHPARSN